MSNTEKQTISIPDFMAAAKAHDHFSTDLSLSTDINWILHIVFSDQYKHFAILTGQISNITGEDSTVKDTMLAARREVVASGFLATTLIRLAQLEVEYAEIENYIAKGLPCLSYEGDTDVSLALAAASRFPVVFGEDRQKSLEASLAQVAQLTAFVFANNVDVEAGLYEVAAGLGLV